MDSDYQMIFSGTQAQVILLKSQLALKNIVPIIKNEKESVRLSGFAHPVSEQIKVFVHNDEAQDAISVLSELNL
ncbi:DUF2007 domain-containing protein [Flavobacteriaceae bacterium M23B6Z8]